MLKVNHKIVELTQKKARNICVIFFEHLYFFLIVKWYNKET